MNLNTRKHSLILTLLLVSGACTTASTSSIFNKFDDLEISSSFSSQTITTRPFAVYVSGIEHNLDNSGDADEALKPEKAAAILARELRSIRSDLQIHESTLADRDKKKVEEIVAKFADNQEMPSHAYSSLQKLRFGESWFLISSLESNETQQNVTQESMLDKNDKVTGTKFTFISSRHLKVRYFIYDIKKSQLVFSGLVKSTIETTHDKIKTEAEQSPIWDAIMRLAGHTEKSEYPEMPSLRKALQQNFKLFSNALPASGRR